MSFSMTPTDWLTHQKWKITTKLSLWSTNARTSLPAESSEEDSSVLSSEGAAGDDCSTRSLDAAGLPLPTGGEFCRCCCCTMRCGGTRCGYRLGGLIRSLRPLTLPCRRGSLREPPADSSLLSGVASSSPLFSSSAPTLNTSSGGGRAACGGGDDTTAADVSPASRIVLRNKGRTGNLVLGRV
ncbi:hypothetical protein U9M48_021308 [Paspalum notatum var. saurae]|uniref:Uncharacterized protein n=1 Tax=Paspalum notatum var. saurae TaxID=547442 RepID=A0AAQ3WTG2_PASNO